MNRQERHFRGRVGVLIVGGALIAALFPMAGSVLAAPNPPSVPALATASDSGPIGDGITNDTTPTFTGTALANSTVRLLVNSVLNQSGAADASTGTWSITTSALAEGTYSISATATDSTSGTSAPSAASSVTILTPPSVTVRPATSQANPTSTSPVTFSVVFSHAVTNFVASDVTLSASTAGGTLTPTLSGSGSSYSIAVTGMTTAGTVVASVVAGVAGDVAGNVNTASSNTDNSVSWDPTAGPTVTINQATGQSDPASTSPINFTVVFSASVTGFDGTDVTLSGTAGATTALVTGSGTTYNVAVSGMTGNGTVIATIGADRAVSSTGNHPNHASTSSDNSVTYQVGNKFLVTSSSYSPVPGAAVTITAQLANASGTAVATSGLVVTWSSTGTGGSFSASTSTTNSSGIATVTFTTSTTTGTAHTVTATSGTATGTSATITTTGVPATISLTRSHGMITYGESVTFSVQFGTGGGNRSFVIEYTSVGVPWTTIATPTTNSSGFASATYAPTRTGYVRARFAGATDLGAATSTVYIVGVRQTVSTLSPHHAATMAIGRGTSIQFRTTVRPLRADLAPTSVTFRFYHKVGGSWILTNERRVLTDSSGVARTTYRFSSSGGWYVRAYAPRTPYNSITRYTLREYYLVP